MFNFAPAWVRKGAKIDLDFANQKYWGGYVSNVRAFSAPDRMNSLLTTGSNNAAGVNYSLDRITGLLIPQIVTATIRLVPGTGLYTETDTSNTCLWCRDLTNAAWVKTTMTAAKDQIGMDGLNNVASSLLATGVLATVLQTLALDTSGFRSYSVYIKRLIGTGTISISLDGVGWTDVTSQINGSTYTRVFITATSANPVVGIQISTNGDKIAVDFNQQEKLTGTGAPLVPTSPQLTTSTATTRLGGGATEEPFFNTSSTFYNDGIRWINDVVCKTPTSFVIEAAGNAPAAVSCLIAGTDIGGYGVFGGLNGSNMTGAVVSATGGIAGIDNLNKMAYSRDGLRERACVNGNTIASANSAFSNTQATHGGIGNQGSGNLSINGYFKRVTFWNRMLSDGEMLEYTR